MSKSATIQQFAAEYNNVKFSTQMMAMTAIAKALGLKMWFESSKVSEGMVYQFNTVSGRTLTKVTLQEEKAKPLSELLAAGE